MYADINKINKKIDITVKEEDLCYLCSRAEECPLLAAIQEEAVILRYENIEVDNCGLYREYTLDQLIAF